MDQETYQKLRERVVYFLKLLKTIKSKRLTRWSVEDLRNAVKWAKLIEKQLETIPTQVVDEILRQEYAGVDSVAFRNSRNLLWESLLENPAVAQQLLDSMFSVSEDLEETEDSFLQVLAEHVSKSCIYETCCWTMQRELSTSPCFYLLSLVDHLCCNRNCDVEYHSFFGNSAPPDTIICSHSVSGFYQSLAYGEAIVVQEQQYFNKHGNLLLELKWKEVAKDGSLLHLFLSILLVVHEKRPNDENGNVVSISETQQHVNFYSQLEQQVQVYVSSIFSSIDWLEQNPIVCVKVAEHNPWFANLLIPYVLDFLEDTLGRYKLQNSSLEFSNLTFGMQRAANMLQLVITKR
ncbi:uncharacterized protein Gasu_09370 [Galdieria sulphuraria]|uniref:Uncharacterized protein n=1 Tax=Galdieria sulphuraria TaxID=130081 RepID=M2W7S6_GALSU|nr:uncharacterized protein Gasu_09370 [Galdieria sulphuraria]EME31866.1 hypothetical protein Gasu_09370 [Galdieria sulphuraria]|eukprot:XP_005708386.1 hypothetical protein Gasu_09370 [Galdieria sulphuraria]